MALLPTPTQPNWPSPLGTHAPWLGDLIMLSVKEIDNMSSSDPNPANVPPILVPCGFTSWLKILVAMYLKCMDKTLTLNPLWLPISTPFTLVSITHSIHFEPFVEQLLPHCDQYWTNSCSSIQTWYQEGQGSLSWVQRREILGQLPSWSWNNGRHTPPTFNTVALFEAQQRLMGYYITEWKECYHSRNATARLRTEQHAYSHERKDNLQGQQYYNGNLKDNNTTMATQNIHNLLVNE